MLWNVKERKPAAARRRVVVDCLDDDLDCLIAGIHSDANLHIFKSYFVSVTITVEKGRGYYIRLYQAIVRSFGPLRKSASTRSAKHVLISERGLRNWRSWAAKFEQHSFAKMAAKARDAERKQTLQIRREISAGFVQYHSLSPDSRD